ncbi:MAG TPA: hypothetical protein VMM55_14050, partial [Thermohalobaculum sp.]|nr:hypothetical protein [Thermohalobaculum sp.]
MRDCETLAETAQPVARPVRAGSVHEIRVRLAWPGGAEAEGPAAPAGLSLAMLRVRFFDLRDEPVDPRLATADHVVPHLDPMPVEVIRRSTAPGGAAGSDLPEKLAAAGTVTRYFVAPPDAVRAEFAAETAGVAIADLQVAPLDVHWLSDGQTFAEAAAEDVEQRCRLIEQVLAEPPEGDDQAGAAMREIPAAQIAAIRSQFGRTGEWARVLERIGTEAEAR